MVIVLLDSKDFIILEDWIQKEYHYVYDENHVEDFYAQPFIHLEVTGRTAYFWVTIEGEEYLFKPIEDFHWNVWGELLSSEFAKILGIPCASYRACSFGGNKGVITKKIQKSNETLILMVEVIQQVFNLHPKMKEKYFQRVKNMKGDNAKIISYFNNVEVLYDLIPYYPRVTQEECKNIQEFLIQYLFFEIITLQADCNMQNYGLLRGNTLYPSPIFDNAASFGLGYPQMEFRNQKLRQELMNYRYFKDEQRINQIIYESDPLFTLSMNTKGKKYHTMLEYLLKSYPEFISLFSFYLKKIESYSLKQIIKNLEEKNKIVMDEEVKYYISVVLEQHFENLKEVVDRYEKECVHRTI